MIQVDGFTARNDLSEKSEDELIDLLVDASINLAHKIGTSIEAVLDSALRTHRATKIKASQ